MTWKSHSLANGALALAATGRLDVTLAAILTATLPDQLERFVPWKRHRGASHWLAFWVLVLVTVPLRVHPVLTRQWPDILRGWGNWHRLTVIVGASLFGLALGPVLHVLLDGCSSRGVPLLPFSRARLRLSLYRTGNPRGGTSNPSEWFFLVCLLGVSALVWRAAWWWR